MKKCHVKWMWHQMNKNIKIVHQYRIVQNELISNITKVAWKNTTWKKCDIKKWNMKIVEHEKRSTGRERWKNEISATWKEETAIWKLYNMLKTQNIGSMAGNQSTKSITNKMQHEESADMNKHNTRESSMKKVQRVWVKYGKIHKNSAL